MTDAVVAEFEVQLAELARAFDGRPKEELDVLWTIGVEREAIVTVAYREGVILERLARMPIDAEARGVVARAIRWAWRDEEAHTLWVRGALLRRSDLGLRAGALAAQIEGWVGGWVSSRQNHLAWRHAPVSRLVAEGIETMGVLGGRIPPAVRDALHWNTFADFCRFNRSAETTAAMAWRRMAELSSREDVAEHDEARGFLRMALDEERHARIFTILADAFGHDDRLSLAADELRARLHGVGQRFVAMPDAGAPAWRNPLGKGGKVVVREGIDVATAVGDVLSAMEIERVLDEARARSGASPRVAIKTSFMLIADRRDPTPGVSIEVLAQVVEWLETRGATVAVVDARNYYDQFRHHRSVENVARYLGIAGEVIDAQDDQVAHDYARGMGVDTIARPWRDADVRVLLGKLRSHPTATALLSLEASEGLGARVGDHVFVERRADRETAALMVLDAFPPHAALLDAYENVPDGLLGILGSEQPLTPRRIYGSLDAVALDATVMRHLGADPAREGTLVAEAFDWFGDPRSRTTVDGIDAPIAGFRLPDHSLLTSALSAIALPVFTHASARGALFLPDFDDDAFPPIEEESLLVRGARATVRRIVADGGSAPVTTTEGLLPTHVVRAPDAVRVARIGGGPPLVCLHGYPETLQVWSRVAPLLAPTREVIAFDWPGLGCSAKVDGPADPAALAEHLRGVLDVLGLERVDLLAADMGGPPALLFAARWPERVGTIVVTSSLLIGDAPTSVEISIMRRTGLASAAFRVAPGIVYSRCKSTFLPDGEELSPELDADFWTAFHRPEVRTRLAKMCADYEHALPGLPEVYPTITRPVRLLWAEDDGHFPPRQAERFCELLPSAERVVLAGARHWMALSRPTEVAAHVARFLGEAT